MFRKKDPIACALTSLDRRDFAGAERAFCELLDRPGTAVQRAFLLNKRGVARIGLERRELARADFADALEALPGYAPALTNLGNLLLEDGDLPGAIARYERAIANDREYHVAHLNLAVAYKRQGRIADSVRALRDAQRLERASLSTFWRRARPR
ncbi:MAG: tetratricopeptide repeat protein [Candidatus Eremiobacteraeota bacterium]|nr:tetratricopeptide repeat protein [Candidatus Eremiobacteraeota bacterium]MBV8499745.1 tetratricopeptide repeat protein [Candidatus Eremiobacteraeota bacterium]